MPDLGSENPPKRRKASRRNSQFAVEYLLGHPTASNEEVVKRTGCSARSVVRARAMLVATGQLQRSYYDRQHRPLGPNEDGSAPAETPSDESLSVVTPRDPSALEKALREDHGPALTPDQMKQRYSAIARFAAKTGEFTLEIQAMTALGRLDSQTGSRNKLGPGIPHTREDRRDRVVPIAAAAGPSIVAEAVVIAYEQDELATFLNEMGRFMARKAENEQLTQNPPVDRASSPLEGPISGEAVVGTEVGGGSGDDRGEAGAPSGGE